jgi:endonuclease/exonuclease/phosphatase family metal-dependent hydrolase
MSCFEEKGRSMPLLFLRRYPILVLLVAAGLFAWFNLGCQNTDYPKLNVGGGPGGNEFLFCFWNVENFFDDRRDGRTGPGDKEYDGWFADHPEILQLKLSKLTEALLKMNGGRGPDILALAEVESVRAAELLQQALNKKLADPALHYQAPLMKEISLGRHIAPAILTRLPVTRDRTRNFGNKLRIIEGHINVNNHELIVLASHWTSRLKETNEKGRLEYADKLYGVANSMYISNPQADVLICGDFNDSPTDVSVTQHLHGTGDLQAVRGGGRLQLLNLMANKDPAAGFGTHFYQRWMIFDQILVTPGMLDSLGWSSQPGSTQTVNTLVKPGDRQQRPWRFGGHNEQGARGYSDHFPVTVKLQVAN